MKNKALLKIRTVSQFVRAHHPGVVVQAPLGIQQGSAGHIFMVAVTEEDIALCIAEGRGVAQVAIFPVRWLVWVCDKTARLVLPLINGNGILSHTTGPI